MTSDPILFSIIVPVYKVEAYLDKCVKSILMQTYPHFELILVDDGSPDSCPNMCDNFAKEDARIRVIHQKNAGLSMARNNGVKESKGDYVIFVDSDDFWNDKEGLSSIICKISKVGPCDTFIFGCYDYDCITGKTVLSNGNYELDDIEPTQKHLLIKSLLKKDSYPGAAWLLVVKRSLIVSNSIYFIKGIKAEDYDWILNVFIHAESIAMIDKPFYTYLKHRNGSIATHPNLDSVKGQITTLSKWYNNLNSNHAYKYLLPVLNKLYLLTIYNYCRGEEKNNTLERELYSYNSLLKHAVSKKYKLLSWTYRLLGFNFATKLISLIHK